MALVATVAAPPIPRGRQNGTLVTVVVAKIYVISVTNTILMPLTDVTAKVRIIRFD